ncbi:MAG: 2-hydroxyacid dehydrogenase [Candidatus Omnitrophica bacterium]|nr:2-hydroxyacid dehydrogenase [Candidatus Omnitrophota bacterium]
MAEKKILFYDTKEYDKDFFNEINKKYKFEIDYFNEHLNEKTVSFSKGYDVVCVFVNDIVNKKVIDALIKNGVKLIALRCAGYNNVNLQSVYGNIHVVRVPGYSPYAVAEHAVALILGLNRKTHRAYYRTRDGNFSINGLMGFDLHGKTAGIIGTGQIGKCAINILKGFGMNILAYDILPDKNYAKKNKISYVSLDKLYKDSDIISLHCPMTKDTFHLIDKQTMKKMKKGVMIINTGRGGLINTGHLIEMLKKGHVGSAGLDVYEEESDYFFEDLSSSVIRDDVLARLLTFSNVLITSHQGFFTKEALTNIADTTLSNVQEFFKGGYLKNEICYKCNKVCQKKKNKRCF